MDDPQREHRFGPEHAHALQAVHVENAALGQYAQQREIDGHEHAQRREHRVRAKTGKSVAHEQSVALVGEGERDQREHDATAAEDETHDAAQREHRVCAQAGEARERRRQFRGMREQQSRGEYDGRRQRQTQQNFCRVHAVEGVLNDHRQR